MKTRIKPIRSRNPIAKAVRRIRPKVVLDRRRKLRDKAEQINSEKER